MLSIGLWNSLPFTVTPFLIYFIFLAGLLFL